MAAEARGENHAVYLREISNTIQRCGYIADAERIRTIATEIERLTTEVTKMRLQRDVLALNEHGSVPNVFIVFDEDGDVADVVWNEGRAATERIVRMPAWVTEEPAQRGATETGRETACPARMV